MVSFLSVSLLITLLLGEKEAKRMEKKHYFEKKRLENFHIPLKNSIFAVRN
jgi:hypothetical protein